MRLEMCSIKRIVDCSFDGVFRTQVIQEKTGLQLLRVILGGIDWYVDQPVS